MSAKPTFSTLAVGDAIVPQSPISEARVEGMERVPGSHKTCDIAIIVTPHFNMSATMGFVDPLRATNYLNGQILFRWRFFSIGGGATPASNGAEILTEPAAQIETPPFLALVSSSWTPEDHAPGDLLTTLRRWARFGSLVGGLDTGAFVLAEAGLLRGYRATVHYEHMDSFSELYPNVELSEDLYVIDRGRWTACGGGAAIDLGLQFVLRRCGAAHANAAARFIFHERLRNHGERQLSEHCEPVGASVPARLHTAIRLIESNLEEPLPIPQIATEIGLSQRQLGRLFAVHVGCTPQGYYRDARLDRARGLVTQTSMPISEAALGCGFSSAEHFSRAYVRRFGLTPSADRVAARVPFEFRAWPMAGGAVLRDKNGEIDQEDGKSR